MSARLARPDPWPALPGIDLNADGQLALLEALASYYPALPFTDRDAGVTRYHFGQPWFGQGDAIALYGLLRHFEPRCIIEVGCGYTSALVLDTVERFFDEPPAITLIDPAPSRLRGLLRREDGDRVRVLEAPVQAAPPETFDALGPGDLLFIDSSHVVTCGSDVQFLLFDVIPRLPPGVLVHFHDVFYPFEYPAEWLRQGRDWNEAYFLRAFLAFNRSWRIRLFNSYAGRAFAEFLSRRMPRWLENPGGSLYVERVADD
jgi:hypothetical protein